MSETNGDINATLDRVRRIVTRRRWWIILSTVVVTLGTIRVSFIIPDRYRSEGILLISKPRVPEQYIVPNNVVNEMESVDAITREIFSRVRLLQVIDEFNLYPEKRHLGKAALSELMRKDIEIQPLSKNPERRPINAFSIAFTAADPHTAQLVTTRLTSLFIEQNVQSQQDMDAGTTAFLEEQLASARSSLDAQETRLRDYKMRNLGNLPEQQASNMEVLSGLQLQLQTAEANLARAQQQHTYLESMLSQYGPVHGTRESSVSAANGSIAEIRADLSRLRTQRDDLLSRYSALYPDVIAINQRIADNMARLQRLASKDSSDPHNKGTDIKIDVDLPPDPATLQLRSQLEANNQEIADSVSLAKRLNAELATYRQRLTLAPLREQQLQQVQRDYDLSKQNYTNLLNKKTQSELATKMAIQQRSGQYQIVDAASFPLKPSGPQRKKIALAALAAGLVLGLALAFFIDARDRTFHSEEEVRACFGSPLVVAVPGIRTSQETRSLVRNERLQWVGACLLLLILAVAEAYVYRRG